MTITLLVPKIETMPYMDDETYAQAVSRLGYRTGFHTEYGRQAIRVETVLTKVPQDLLDAGLEFVSFEMVRANVPNTAAIAGTYEGGGPDLEHERGITAHAETYIRDGIRCQTLRVTGTDLTVVASYLERLAAGKRNQDCLLAAENRSDQEPGLTPEELEDAQNLVLRLHGHLMGNSLSDWKAWSESIDWPKLVDVLRLSVQDGSTSEM